MEALEGDSWRLSSAGNRFASFPAETITCALLGARAVRAYISAVKKSNRKARKESAKAAKNTNPS
jgi:hypothetical protein